MGRVGHINWCRHPLLLVLRGPGLTALAILATGVPGTADAGAKFIFVLLAMPRGQ